MKMSDVFGCHDVWVSDIVATIEHDNVHSPMDESYVLESCSEYVLNSKIEMEAAAHAINKHGALVEFVCEFRDFAVRQGWQHVLINKANKILEGES